RPEPWWGGGVLRGASDVAGQAESQVEDRRRPRLRQPVGDREPPVHVLPSKRQRSHVGARYGIWKGLVANGLSRSIQNESRSGALRRRPEIDARLCEWEAVHDWHDRHRHGIRRRGWETTLAEAGVTGCDALHHALVFSTHRTGPRHLP